MITKKELDEIRERHGLRDADFLSCARVDIPRLIAEVKQLEGERDHAEGDAERARIDARGSEEEYQRADTRAQAVEAQLEEVRKNLTWIRATETDVVLLSELSRIEHDDREAERNYAIERWVRLENKYEVPRHAPEEPWTVEEMLAETRKALDDESDKADETAKPLNDWTEADLLDILEKSEKLILSEDAHRACRRFQELLDMTNPTADDYNRILGATGLKEKKR